MAYIPGEICSCCARQRYVTQGFDKNKVNAATKNFFVTTRIVYIHIYIVWEEMDNR